MPRDARVGDWERSVGDMLVAENESPSTYQAGRGGGEVKLGNSPAAHPTCKDLNDDVVLLGILPRHGDLLQLTAAFKERPRCV